MSHRPIEYQGEDSVGRIERRRQVTHLSPGEEGQTVRLFDGATYAFRSRGEGYALLESTAPPGGGMPPHTHHTQDEVIYVLEGEFSFASGAGALTLGPGCVVSVPKGTVHVLKVSGREPGRCLLLLAPPGPLERFLEEVGAPVTDGAPFAGNDSHPRMETDAEKVRESARRNGIELLITPV
jgi:quercetin dioxygenase-like cupin family protein